MPFTNFESRGFERTEPPSGHPSPLVRGAVPAPPQGKYGDRAGEHLEMQRGRYSAWTYVVFAFVGQFAFLAAVLVAVGAACLGADMDRSTGETVHTTLLCVGLAVGLAGALWTFWNRWRVNEAFSSRFCSGIMNLSILYVPVVSWMYANYRAIQKLRRH